MLFNSSADTSLFMSKSSIFYDFKDAHTKSGGTMRIVHVYGWKQATWVVQIISMLYYGV